MPTVDELKALNPGLSPEQIQTLAKADGIKIDEDEGGFFQRLRSLAPMAGGAIGQYGADAVVTALGSPELIPVAGAAGNALGSAAGRMVDGDTTSAKQFGVDAVMGAATPYVGPALRMGGKMLGAVRDAVPAAARGVGYGVAALMGHSPGTAAADAALAGAIERGPEALAKTGDAVDWAGKKLMAPFEPVAPSGRPMVDTSAPPSTPFKRQPLRDEIPYRMGSGTSEPTANPFKVRPGVADPNVLPDEPASISALASHDVTPPKYPPLQSSDPIGSVNDMVTNQRGIDWMHDEFERNNPIFRKMAESGTFGDAAKGEQLAARGSFNAQRPEVLGVDDFGPSEVGQMLPSHGEVDDILAQLKPTPPAENVTEPYETPSPSQPNVTNTSGRGDELSADTEAQAAKFRAAARHGKSGFSKFPAQSVPSVRSLEELADSMPNLMRKR